MTTPAWHRTAAWLTLAAIWFLAIGAHRAYAQSDSLQAAVALEGVLVKAIERGEKSVVAIARVRKQENQRNAAVPVPFRLPSRLSSPADPEFIPNEFGAGVVVDAAGLILTASHVLGDTETSAYYVWSEHKPFKAEVIASAPWFDLAVLKVDATDLKPVTFGDASLLRKGQIVIALGNPYAIARDGSVSASWGIVSNLNRQAPRTPTRSADPLGRETLHNYGTLIQTDSKLNMGYSGGALLNLKGEMIGLTTALTASPEFETAAGFAMPVDADFKRVVEALKKGESPEFGFLGVGPEPLDESLRRKGVHGARVVTVIRDTPADKAGIRVDDVITSVNGQPIYNNDDLFRRIGALGPGQTAVLTVARGDITDPNVATLNAVVKISKKRTAALRPAISTVQKPAWRGLRVDYATASLRFSRLVERPPGDSLVVTSVREQSPAWKAGIRAGDFITHVGDSKVISPKHFASLVQDQAGDVILHVTRDGRQTTARTVSP